MHRSSSAVCLLACVALMGGCKKEAAPSVPDAAAPPAAAVPKPPDAVAAYVADCAHTFPFTPEPLSDDVPQADECLAVAFDQNRAPDLHGCWSAEAQCKTACAGPCDACQARCAGTCQSCKDQCAKAQQPSSCVRDCAEARANCRQDCLAAHTACMDEGCTEKEHQCTAAAEKKRDQKCPDCDALRECLTSKAEQPDAAKTCGRAFPKDDAQCLTWCAPFN